MNSNAVSRGDVALKYVILRITNTFLKGNGIPIVNHVDRFTTHKEE